MNKVAVWQLQKKGDGEWVNMFYRTSNSLDAEQAKGAFDKADPEIEHRILFNDPWHTDVVWDR